MRIKSFFLYMFLSIFIINLSLHTAFAQDTEVLTNNTIIKMVKAKLGEDVIINKIKNSKTNFDLSTDGLIMLKEAGISDTIISAMQNPQAGQPPAQPSKEMTAVSSAEMLINQSGKLVEMEYVAGFTKILGSSMWAVPFSTPKVRFVIMASGEHAAFRINEKNPVFYTKLHPSDIGLVKFDTDTYNKKPVRYVLRVGEMWQTSGQAAGPAQSNIDFDFKKESNRLYKITMKAPLENGEYGIIASKGDNTGNPWNPSASYKIFDFAVVK